MFKKLKIRPQPLISQLSAYPQSEQAFNKNCKKKKKNYCNYNNASQKSLKSSISVTKVNMIEPKTLDQKEKNNQKGLN